MLIGIFLFAGLGIYLIPVVSGLFSSKYNRSGIERICNEMFGNVKVNDILTDEVLIVSYEYN